VAQPWVPDRLLPLVEQLRGLDPEERSIVVRAANEVEGGRGIPANELRRVVGLVKMGGDAVADCETLYDDV
jgi:hypothetical protein